MRRLVRLPRRGSWSLVVALVALLALSGCGDTPASNPPEQGGGADIATATPTANPTPAQIAGWRTYSDSTYAFSIQYAPTWTTTLEPQPPNAPYEVVAFFPGKSGSNGAAPTQNVITVTAAMNQPDVIDSAVPPGFAPDGSVSVGGTTQPLLSGPGSAGGQGLAVMMALSNEVFLFYSTADDASAALFRQTFTQMLSTFQIVPTYE